MESYWRHTEAPDIEALNLLYRLEQESSAARFRECHIGLIIDLRQLLARSRH
jgi:hypothetical protein